jgi:1,3-beta-glucan synthase
MKFDRIQWGRVFSKTYYERRSLGQWLVNFNRIWVIHIAIYWFYTAYNSPSVYNGARSTPMRWSTTALGGAVATLIMIAATFAEFSHLPTSWSNISYLTRRLLCLLVILSFTAGPTFYIAKTESRTPNQRIPLILGIVQFTVSVAATLIFSVTPSGLMFGGRVVGRSRKSPAGQTFTASYPSMTTEQRLSSVFLWFLVFGCKFAGSYFFLTLSFRQSINAMVGLKVKACTDKYFGDALCANQVIFALTIMYIVDLVLFFLDTFLWWIIWNAIFSIVRSFYLGVSTWKSWRAMHSKLPTRIYSQILATSYLDIEHKPEVGVSLAV